MRLFFQQPIKINENEIYYYYYQKLNLYFFSCVYFLFELEIRKGNERIKIYYITFTIWKENTHTNRQADRQFKRFVLAISFKEWMESLKESNNFTYWHNKNGINIQTKWK